MIYPKIPLAQTVVELCKAKGIKHIIISPGSRNAPLTIGFTHNPYFKCYSIVDERCASFFALGIAQQLQEPTAIVCTSGSAVLNYYPAVAEAFYSDIPLVILSADRPKYLIGIGDGQTINQKNIFSNHILYSANLKLDIDVEYNKEEQIPILKSIENNLEKFLGLQQSIQEENEKEINKAINKSITEKGPVHINIPFNEPLYDLVKELSVSPKVIPIKNDDNVKTNQEHLEELISAWNHAQRKMVLVGVNQPNAIEQRWLDILAKDETIVVFSETTSNLHNKGFFPSIDKIIAPLNDDEFKKLQPDILLTFGGMIVSKKVKAFLRQFKPKHHWHVNEKKANDTFFSLTKYLKGDPNTFLSQLLPKSTFTKSNYRSYWQSVKEYRNQKHKDYLSTIEFSDLKVLDSVLKSIPDDSILQVGNSSAIRYTQLFNINSTLKVFCNRGTSGIDGSTSTAIGCAVVGKEQTILITGDLSFFYDSNALWNDYIPNNFRIIIINNEGGGIFRILPGHKNTENFNTYFETKHQLKASQLCDMYGFKYVSASNENELKQSLESFYIKGDKPKLLEIFTPSTLNDKVLLNYFQYIK